MLGMPRAMNTAFLAIFSMVPLAMTKPKKKVTAKMMKNRFSGQ